MRVAVAGATGLIGRKLVDLAEREGHDVVALSRSGGYDLTDAAVVPRLVEALEGVDAVVDVTQGPDFEQDAAVAFFEAVATHVGDAATRARVSRTVVLSIVGIERCPDYGYYVAKMAHEEAHRVHSPGLRVLRATQFHEFAGQMIDWFTADGVADVMDVEVQPIDSAEVVRALLDLAVTRQAEDVQIAGPNVEPLVALSRAYVAGEGLDVDVTAGDAPASMADGGMLPVAADAVQVRGVDWSTWYEGRGRD